MRAIERKPRLQNGKLGQLEKKESFGLETDQEKIARLEAENANITFTLLGTEMELQSTQNSLKSAEEKQAALIFQLVEKGVI